MPSFTCSICKRAPRADPRFPRKHTWKTEKGLREHRCYTQELADKAVRLERERIRLEQESAALAERIRTAPRKVGDQIFIAAYCVTKPTHEGGRRVRYEEERRYQGWDTTIAAVTLRGYRTMDGHDIMEMDILPTFAAAHAKAVSDQRAYDEGVRFAQQCR